MRCAASAAHRFRANVRKCRFSSASIQDTAGFRLFLNWIQLDTNFLGRFGLVVYLLCFLSYLVRPSGFEPPTFCSGGRNPRRIRNLHGLSQSVTSYYFQGLTGNPCTVVTRGLCRGWSYYWAYTAPHAVQSQRAVARAATAYSVPRPAPYHPKPCAPHWPDTRPAHTYTGSSQRTQPNVG